MRPAWSSAGCGATSEQLGEAARQLGVRLQRHQAALAASLTAVIERGGGLLAEAEDRRNQRAAELDRAGQLLRSAMAWIQPAPAAAAKQPAG